MTLANASLNSLVRCKMRPCLNAGGGRVRIELDSLIEIGNRSIMVAVFITDQAAVTVHAVVVNSAFGIDFDTQRSGSFAPTAIWRTVGRVVRKSKPRSRRGLTQRVPMRRRRLLDG